MDILYLCAFLCALWKIKWQPCRTEDYLKKQQTQAINGFFVLLVFFRHFGQYIDYGQYDMLFQRIDGRLGQLIVTTFLFYSGYGVLYSIKNKPSYIDTLPRRTLRILVQFDMAVLVFLLIKLAMNKRYSLSRILLSFVGWEGVGNSNWYIMAILCLYVITYISGKLTKGRSKDLLILLVVLGCFIYIVLLRAGGKEAYWYNTIFCFPAGMLYGEHEDSINAFLKKKWYHPLLFTGAALGCFVVFYKCRNISTNPWIGLGIFGIYSLMFVLFVVSVTLLFRIDNPLLSWLGSNLFEVYILQRIPMLVLKNVIDNKYLYFGLCFVSTLLLAVIFQKLESLVTRVLFGRT